MSVCFDLFRCIFYLLSVDDVQRWMDGLRIVRHFVHANTGYIMTEID